jgi:hypothetical protein
MAITVNNMPSINLPLTNEQGIIHPIWYEFFRAVISNLGATSGGTTADNTVIAGSGIIGTGAISTVNVGAGEGVIVNADSVGVDILHQVNVQAALEDEILISDASSGSAIKKTSLRDVAALSVANPGGLTTQMQYNNAGAFGGDSGVTTDGAGNLSINGSLVVDNMTFNGTTISSSASSNKFSFEVPAGSTNPFTFTQNGGASSGFDTWFVGLRGSCSISLYSDNLSTTNLANASLDFITNNGGSHWSMGLYDSSTNDDFVFSTAYGLNTGQVYTISGATGNYFQHQTLMQRKVTNSITASTTQTQGQGALTSDINRVSVCANANDTVTLPSATAGMSNMIFNDGAQTLKIFPASGDDLGAGVNTATTLAAGGKAWFVSYDATTWKRLI